jgi:hypothetical protein
MASILGEYKQQQVLALGRLGWPLRRIQAATGVRREMASAYLKAAGIGLKGLGGHLKTGQSWTPMGCCKGLVRRLVGAVAPSAMTSSMRCWLNRVSSRHSSSSS